MKDVVPVLITCDIDPTPEVCLENKKHAITLTMELFEEYGIKSTFLFVANMAKLFNSEIKKLQHDGHEIGCHGLTHHEEEEYNRLPEGIQREYLTTATKILEDLTEHPVRSFRGPRVKTSHITHKILEELNYSADCSVCSQRIDLVSSNLINTGWIFAPRLPYHPSINSAFKKGTRRIVVVPVSAIVLPFISGTLYIFGLQFMKKLFDILYLESKKSGKPIVYLMHPAEFVKHTKEIVHKPSLSAIRARGFYFRRKLKLFRDENKRLHYTIKLFEYMRKFADIKFMTVNHYVESITHNECNVPLSH